MHLSAYTRVNPVSMIQREVLPGSLCVRSALLIQVRGKSQEPAVRTHGPPLAVSAGLYAFADDIDHVCRSQRQLVDQSLFESVKDKMIELSYQLSSAASAARNNHAPGNGRGNLPSSQPFASQPPALLPHAFCAVIGAEVVRPKSASIAMPRNVSASVAATVWTLSDPITLCSVISTLTNFSFFLYSLFFSTVSKWHRLLNASVAGPSP